MGVLRLFRVAVSSIYGFHPFFENVDYLRVVTLSEKRANESAGLLSEAGGFG
jgi:hypothetical protein